MKFIHSQSNEPQDLHSLFMNYLVFEQREKAEKNEKLKKRAIGIVCDIMSLTEKESQNILETCSWDIKLSCVFILTNDLNEAKNILAKNSGNLRKCLAEFHRY